MNQGEIEGRKVIARARMRGCPSSRSGSDYFESSSCSAASQATSWGSTCPLPSTLAGSARRSAEIGSKVPSFQPGTVRNQSCDVCFSFEEGSAPHRCQVWLRVWSWPFKTIWDRLPWTTSTTWRIRWVRRDLFVLSFRWLAFCWVNRWGIDCHYWSFWYYSRTWTFCSWSRRWDFRTGLHGNYLCLSDISPWNAYNPEKWPTQRYLGWDYEQCYSIYNSKGSTRLQWKSWRNRTLSSNLTAHL